MDGNMLTADKVYFNYNKDDDGSVKAALEGIDFKVEKGEFVAVIGHNGSGKSTLAKHFNAILLPIAGTIKVKDMDTKDGDLLLKIRQTAGMVFQNPDNQIVATIVEEDVAFGPENLGVAPDEIRKRVDNALKTVNMEEYAHHGPHLLSGGQKQRVAIAGVLAMHPECIIFDEPTAMLDPLGRKEVLATIKKLNKEEGITIVLITHYMEEAVDADRVVVMDDGKVVLDGKPKQVFSHVKELKKLGLDVPQMTELSYKLRNSGIETPEDILTIDEMVEALCRL